MKNKTYLLFVPFVGIAKVIWHPEILLNASFLVYFGSALAQAVYCGAVIELFVLLFK